MWALFFLAIGSAGPSWCQAADASTDVADASPSGKEAKKTVLVFAAASTANAIDEIRARFTQETGIDTQTSYGSSATLAQQIINGADADVFVSADAKWGDYLKEKGLVAQKHDLLGNRLVIVTPSDSKLDIRKPEDLLAASVEHLAMGDPNAVPAGKYAKQALMKLNLWDSLKSKVASAEDVRHALAFVETGAAEAGIVYSTDAAISKKVKVAADIPESLTGTIRYPLVLLKHDPDRPAAQAFYKYLASKDAAEIFRKFGFAVLADLPPSAK
jgi:molybdate transport system substrate-binding protein